MTSWQDAILFWGVVALITGIAIGAFGTGAWLLFGSVRFWPRAAGLVLVLAGVGIGLGEVVTALFFTHLARM